MKCKLCQYCHENKKVVKNTCIICDNVFESTKRLVCDECSKIKGVCQVCGKLC